MGKLISKCCVCQKVIGVRQGKDILSGVSHGYCNVHFKEMKSMYKHKCKVCGKHLGYHNPEDRTFRCYGEEVDGEWKCKYPFKG